MAKKKEPSQKKKLPLIPIILGAIALAIIVLGFALGLTKEGLEGCTMMYCEPPSDCSSELPCNSCTSIRPVFSLGFFTISNSCPTREYVSCSGEREYRKGDGSCSISLN